MRERDRERERGGSETYALFISDSSSKNRGHFDMLTFTKRNNAMWKDRDAPTSRQIYYYNELYYDIAGRA